MAAAATVSIIMLLLAGLVLAGFIVGIVLWITGGRSRGHGEMACGGCGYSVRGLEQLHCPECGADLRAVGITNGGSGGKRLTGILLTSICGFILLSCCGLSAFSWMATGVSHQSSPNPTVPVQSHSAPKPTPDAAEPADPTPLDAPDPEPEESGADPGTP